jgi:hypothetical protein
MNTYKFPKGIVKQEPTGRRHLGRPLKRWKHCFIILLTVPNTGESDSDEENEDEDDGWLQKGMKSCW